MDMDFISQLLQIVIMAIAPILAAAAVRWLMAKSADLKAEVEAATGYKLDAAIDIAIKAAEQLAASGQIASDDKKQIAIEIAENYLGQFGIKIDLLAIANGVEAAVWREFNSQKKAKK